MTDNRTTESTQAGMAGLGRAAIVSDGVEFAERDVELLEAIDRVGSVAGASSTLGRSRARDLARIEELEAAFGALVDRHRGGRGGGGSTVTANARRLLNRYERLQVALSATARVPEAVLDGTVTAVAGELATARTAAGPIRGLHEGMNQGDPVQIRIGADAVTLRDPSDDVDPDATSARNRLDGTVTGVDPGETVSVVHIDADGAEFPVLVTRDSADRLDLADGRRVALTWKATATRLVAAS